MFRAAARTRRTATCRTFAPGRPRPFEVQGRAISARARQRRLGTGLVGRICSARSATNTTPGRCKIWRKRESLWSPGANCAFEFQARLLGISGLLPDGIDPVAKKSRTPICARVWDCWWRDRDEFGGNCILPRTVWKFHGLRPANHPQRRLALAAHWLADKNLISKVEEMVRRRGIPGRQRARQVRCMKILQVERDEFWSWHWTFKSARLAKPQPLLGGTRATDLAVNVILPWLWGARRRRQKRRASARNRAALF